MVVGLTVFELHLPGSRGLKEKRKVIKGLIDRVHRRYRVSIAETGFHDLRQRSEIALALIAQTEYELDAMMDEIRRIVDATGPEAVVTRWDPQVIEEAR